MSVKQIMDGFGETCRLLAMLVRCAALNLRA